MNLRDEGAARHRNHHVIRQSPSQLLDDLVAQRFRAFRVVGTDIYIHKRPAVLASDFAAEAIHCVVCAADADDIRSVHQRAENFPRFQVGRDEDVTLQPATRRVGRNGICEITSRRAGDNFETQFPCARQGHTDHAVLEGQCRVVDRVILHPDLAQAQPLRQAIRLDERGETDLEADGRLAFDRQQLAIPPHIRGPRLDFVPCQHGLDQVVVVIDFQRAETEFADMQRFFRVMTPALATL